MARILIRMLVMLEVMKEQGIWSSSIPGAVLISLPITERPVQLEGNPNPQCEKKTPAYPCPDGWSQHEDSEGIVCLRIGLQKLTWNNAQVICQDMGGNLVTIGSAARQRTIESLLSGVSEQVWIGLSRIYINPYWVGDKQVTYENFYSSFENYRSEVSRAFLRFEDFKWQWTKQSHNMHFLCDKVPDCYSGYFGERCDKECHCYGEDCLKDQPCQFGCQSGWMGPSCCARREEANITYYCLDSADEGRVMLLRLDPRNVAYDVMTPVDDAGQKLEWCQELTSTKYSDGTYTIKVPVSRSEISSDDVCGGRQTDNDTVTWQILMQEKNGFKLPLDRAFLLTCDFSKAETFNRGIAYSVMKHKEVWTEDLAPPLENVIATKENVILEVVDSYSGDVIREAELGRNVLLRMHLTVSKGISAWSVSPYHCQASSSDSKVIHLLTNSFGCQVPSSPVSSMAGSNGTVSSKPFQLFALQDHRYLVITCNFDFCFEQSQQSLCDDRCAQQTRRTKRDAEKDLRFVSTVIRILPEVNPEKDESHASVENPSPSFMLVTWMISVVLLVALGVLLCVLQFTRKASTGTPRPVHL